MAKSKTHRDYIKTAERRAFVLRLRKAGMTYREIAKSTIEAFGEDVLPKGFDELYAYKDVMRELKKLNEQLAENAAEIRRMDLERLDDMLKGLWPLVTRKRPDQGAIDRVLKIMDRRAKLLGLDEAVTAVLQNIDMNQLTESQLERLADGEDFLSVLANPNPNPGEGGA